MATDKVGYFSVRKFPDRLRTRMRTAAARKQIRESRFVSLEEIHADVVERGLDALEAELRQGARKAAR